MCLAMSILVMAQEKTKQQEVGLSFMSLYRFGITYKIGNSNALWRFNSVMMNGNNHEETTDSISYDNNSNSHFRVNLGREYRKTVTDNLKFRYGADLSFSYASQKGDHDDLVNGDYNYFSETSTYMYGANIVLGLNYVIQDKIVIGAEILPSFYYRTGERIVKNDYSGTVEEQVTDISGIQYGLYSGSVLVSVAYRF